LLGPPPGRYRKSKGGGRWSMGGEGHALFRPRRSLKDVPVRALPMVCGLHEQGRGSPPLPQPQTIREDERPAYCQGMSEAPSGTKSSLSSSPP
jgi:hypothetical protein